MTTMTSDFYQNAQYRLAMANQQLDELAKLLEKWAQHDIDKAKSTQNRDVPMAEVLAAVSFAYAKNQYRPVNHSMILDELALEFDYTDALYQQLSTAVQRKLVIKPRRGWFIPLDAPKLNHNPKTVSQNPFDGKTKPAEKRSGRIIPLPKWNHYHPYPTVNAIRFKLYKKENYPGIEECFRRDGKRILIIEDAFLEFLSRNQY